MQHLSGKLHHRRIGSDRQALSHLQVDRSASSQYNPAALAERRQPCTEAACGSQAAARNPIAAQTTRAHGSRYRTRGGEPIGHGSASTWRVARLPAEAIPQRGCRGRHPERRSQETLARLQEPAPPTRKAEGHPPRTTKTVEAREADHARLIRTSRSARTRSPIAPAHPGVGRSSCFWQSPHQVSRWRPLPGRAAATWSRAPERSGTPQGIRVQLTPRERPWPGHPKSISQGRPSLALLFLEA